MRHDEIWNENGEPMITASELWAEGQANDMAQADIQFEERWNAIEPETPAVWEHTQEELREIGIDPEDDLLVYVVGLHEEISRLQRELIQQKEGQE